jgi:hypothetical protein
MKTIAPMKTRNCGAICSRGESEANSGRLPVHQENLRKMIESLCAGLGQRDLRFIACINARDVKTHIGDKVHIDTAAQLLDITE